MQTTDGGYIVAGDTHSFGAGSGDVWSLKVEGEPAVPSTFDTGSSEKPYPSISSIHNGTITPFYDLNVTKIYTYSCEGTGGHIEYAAISYPNGTVLAEAHWNGYTGDWHNISFNKTFTLYANETYNYTIVTGSYPQIIHEPSWNATGGSHNVHIFRGRERQAA